MTEPRLATLFTALAALRSAHVDNAGRLAEDATDLIRVAETLAALSVSLNARNAGIDGRIAAASGRIRALALRIEGRAFELGVGLEALGRAVGDAAEEASAAAFAAMEDTVPGIPVVDFDPRSEP